MDKAASRIRLLTNIVKKPFAYPKIRVCKDTKYCLSTNYEMDILE